MAPEIAERIENHETKIALIEYRLDENDRRSKERQMMIDKIADDISTIKQSQRISLALIAGICIAIMASEFGVLEVIQHFFGKL